MALSRLDSLYISLNKQTNQKNKNKMNKQQQQKNELHQN